MANKLLVWDKKETIVQRLCQTIGITYPQNVIHSFFELKRTNFILEKDAIVILLETNIDGQKRSLFYGLRIIQYLRKDLRYKGLIVAYSFIDELQFRKMNGTSILFTSGTRLKSIAQNDINADEIEGQIQTFLRLSDDLLDDIRYNVFDAKGQIHELLHNLKNELNDIKGKNALKDFTKEINLIFDEYKKLLLKEIDPFKKTELNKLYSSLITETVADVKQYWVSEKEKCNFSYGNAGNQVNKFTNQIIELAPISSDDENTLGDENINWEVLFFDDTEGVREKVKAFFNAKNVTCHLAATENEVYQRLKENSPNISLFLADIRLLDKNGHWCDRQGYDVIEQVNKTNDYPLVYSVLTSKKGTINKMVQKKRKYEILWFTKDDVINNIHSFNIFFDLVKGYADEHFNSSKVFQPEYGYWSKPYNQHYSLPLKIYYKYHKENYDYQTEEGIINKRTLEYINSEGIKQDWMCKLLKNYVDDFEIKKFRETKLLGRRVALAYAAEGQATTGLSIYNLLTGNSKNTVDSAVKVFFSKLGLSTNVEKIIHQAKSYFKGEVESLGILYEEYEFLKNEFFEEQFINSINLGYEREELKSLIQQIEKALTINKITEPKSFTRVNSILENEGFPKAERLDAMFTDLKELNEQSGYKLLKEVEKHQFLKSVNNETIKELFRKYEWI